MKPAFALLIGFAILVCAMPAVGRVRYYTPGDPECAKFRELQAVLVDANGRIFVRNPRDPAEVAMNLRYVAWTGWFRGVATGVNFFKDADYQLTDRQYMDWVFAYCSSHPESDVVSGIHELMGPK